MTRSAAGVTQESVLKVLDANGEAGATWAELDLELGMGHGAISGALSHLHRAGAVARLRLRRNGSAVYVLSEDVGDRETVTRGRKQRLPAAALEEAYRTGRRDGVNQALTAVDLRLVSLEQQLRSLLGVEAMRLVSKDWTSTSLGTVKVMQAHVANLRKGPRDFTPSGTRKTE